MAEKDLTINIGVKQKGAQDELKKLKKSIDDQNKALETMGKTAGIAFAAVAAGLAFSIKEAIEAERVDKRLEQQLKSMGITSKKLADNMKAVASQIQATSTFGDEELKTTMNHLLVSTNDYNASLEHTRTAADLAIGANVDLKQASMMLGMAFVGNTGRLKQYGIVLEEGVKGHAALAAIQKQFAGQSEAATKTLDGQFKQMKNSVSDLGESIGMEFLPVITKMVTKTKEAVDKLIAWNESSGNAIANAAKWSLGISGALMAIGFLIPKIVEFKKNMVLLNAVIKTNPIIAAAAAVGLLANAIADLGLAYQDNQNKLITDKVNSDKMIERAKEEIKVRQENIKMLEKSGTAYQDKIDIENAAIKKQESLIKGLTANKEQGVQGKPTTTADVLPPTSEGDAPKVKPQFKTGLAEALKKEGEDVDALWMEMDAKRIEALNAKYMTEGELEAAYLDIKVQRIADAQAKEVELHMMTAEQIAQIEMEKNAMVISGLQSLFGDIISLSSIKNKEMFEISKGANIAQATIDTYTGAQKAYTSFASIPPLAIAAAVAATAAGMARVHNIMATGYNAKGAAEGVFDFRASGNNENLVTTLAPGESIIPRKMTDAMKDGSASLGGGGNTYQLILQGDIIGVPRDEFYKHSAQKFNEMIQSGEIPAGQFTGAST